MDLVFCTGGERTTNVALQLALRHIGPRHAYVSRHASPLALSVESQLALHKGASHVVYVPADALILEDMRTFLDANDCRFVNCYGRNRFWGWSKGGVQVVRTDVLLAMQATLAPYRSAGPQSDSHLRSRALKSLGFKPQGKNCHILEEHFQRPEDIFVKFAHRGLWARTDAGLRALISASIERWDETADFVAAREGLNHAASSFHLDAVLADVQLYQHRLRARARAQLGGLSCPDRRGEQSLGDLSAAVARDPASLGPPPKNHHVFGLGLSRTGTRSLTEGLHALGFDTVHYPVDGGTLGALVRGDLQFPALDHYMGLTDITVCRYYEAMDRRFPDSKFVLTVRDEETWLASCRRHWYKSEGIGRAHSPEARVYREIRAFLRNSVYGAQEFDSDRFRCTYRRHIDNVRRYFSGRGDKLLVLDITSGHGFLQLAPFLGSQAPNMPFPHLGKAGATAATA